MEAQIESMHGNLMALKNKPAKEKKKKEKKEEAPVASSSKGAVSRAPKAAPATNGNKRKTTKKPVAEDDVLSFEQKKDLSEAITSLDGVKLEKVIQIIHEGVPEIRDVSEDMGLCIISITCYAEHRGDRTRDCRSTTTCPHQDVQFRSSATATANAETESNR